jgi:hypothetical protein
MYVLDATPMFLAVVLLNIFHPGRVLVGPESKFPSRKERKREKKVLKMQKKERKRRAMAGDDIPLQETV